MKKRNWREKLEKERKEFKEGRKESGEKMRKRRNERVGILEKKDGEEVDQEEKVKEKEGHLKREEKRGKGGMLGMRRRKRIRGKK